MLGFITGLIINIVTSILLLFSGLLYLRIKSSQIKIHKYIAAYTTEDGIEYQFKIVNKSKIEEVKKISIRLRGVVIKQWAFNVFMPSYTDIKLKNESSVIQLDRHTRYSFKKCVKNNDYFYGASHLILTYEYLENLLKTKYSYLQLVVQYTNANNKEFTIKQKFTLEDVKFGHHTNDDKIKNLPINIPKKSYYFAYGSNLNKEQMKERCHDSIEVGSIILSGYQLLFRSHRGSEQGYLTIEKEDKAKVPIGIYLISEDDENKLDGFEGVNSQDYKKERIAIKYKDNYIGGLIYIMNNGKKCKPNDEYYNKVNIGYNQWNFDISYLDVACNECGYIKK
jgi:gamma-glutamylcyclotransferase (GGCT)/AIG2-like uncharacterized protein YtfP